jgi:G6PDH family F420-dependent oxidoreductase
MTQFGYTAMGEQTPARQLITDLVAAEAAGFDFSVMSDHYFPWLEEQGHSPNAWAVLGAAAQATERLPLMTFVTCPTFRYHPAVVAQQAATVGVLSGGRFTLGLGAGENLNEHVIGAAWPTARVRHERLEEAVEIIRQLFAGEYVSYQGRHFQVERAKLYDLPDQAPPVGIAVSGPDSIRLAADHADVMITAGPDGDLVRRFGEQGGAGKPVYGQLAVCYDRDEKAARRRARELWRWVGVGRSVMPHRDAEVPQDGGIPPPPRRRRNRPRAPGGQSTVQEAPWTSETTATAAGCRAASLETWRVWRQAEGQRASSPAMRLGLLRYCRGYRG